MTGTEAVALIGRSGTFAVGDLKVDIKIIDCREVFGRTDVRVEPVAGSGALWVSLGSIQLTA